jgi:hypothetical protein
MKENKFRTSSNLKSLMKSASELRFELHKQTQKSTVRDVSARADFASDLLFTDK